LGLYISDHPAKEYADYFQKNSLPIKNITEQMVGQPVTLGGVITNIHKIFLKNQKTMLFVMIEDLESKIELLVFPKVLENTAAVWQDGVAVLATGKISDKDGNFKLLCDSVKKIDQEELERFERIAVTRQKNGEKENKNSFGINIILPPNSDQATLKKITQILDQCVRGESKVYISINNSRLETPYRIQLSDEKINSLQSAIPEGKIEKY
jgi:DNA polymerase-3 subunit alpha